MLRCRRARNGDWQMTVKLSGDRTPAAAVRR
jgi:hypothetical protein